MQCLGEWERSRNVAGEKSTELGWEGLWIILRGLALILQASRRCGRALSGEDDLIFYWGEITGSNGQVRRRLKAGRLIGRLLQ